MKRRTLLALAASCAALALAVAIDRPARPVAAADRLLPGLDADDVDRLEIAIAGRAPLVLVRDAGVLRLEAPVRAPTSSRAVQELLGTLAGLRWDRRAPRRAARGLDPPGSTIRILGGDERVVELLLGEVDTPLASVWVAIAGDAHAYTVGAWAARALDLTADDLRDHAPFTGDPRRPGDLLVEAGGRRLWLHGDPRCVELERGCARASSRRSAELVARLLDLRVTRFVDGAEASPVEARVVLHDEELRIGGACPGAPDERLASSRLGAACLPARVIDELSRAAENPTDWIERSLFTTPLSRVVRVEIAGDGEALVVERQGKEWVLVDGAGERVPAASVAVRDWLGEILELRASRLVPAAGAPPAGDLPRVTLISEGGTETVALRSVADQRARFVRPGEPVELELHADLARTVIADRLAFRDRTLLSFEPLALRAIEYEGEGGAERAERGESVADWRVTAPFAIAGDADAVGALRDAAHELAARRAEAERAAPPHGLTPARRRVTFVVDPPPTAPEGAPPSRHTIELGAPAPAGGCYARRAGDETVYLVAPEDCEALDAHLGTRRVFEAAGDAIVSITVGGRRYERQGSAWYLAAGGRIPDGEAARALALIRALELAPEVRGYGPIPAGGDAIEIVVELEAGAPIRLRARRGEYALEGRAVRYRVASDVCDEWKELCVTR